LTPVVLEYLRRYPQMSVDLVTEGRKIDIVVSGFDAGIRLAEDVPRDMVSVATADAATLRHRRRAELFRRKRRSHKARRAHVVPCICVRQSNGAPYRWEFERRGRGQR